MLYHLCTKSKRQWWQNVLREERTPQVTSHLWQTFVGFNRNLCRDQHTAFLHTRYIVQSWSWAKWQWVYHVLLSSVWGFLGLFLSGCTIGVSSEWLLQSSSGDFLNKLSHLFSAPNSVPENDASIYSRSIFKIPNIKQKTRLNYWWRHVKSSKSHTVGKNLNQYAVNIVLISVR